jgi:plastocyanin
MQSHIRSLLPLVALALLVTAPRAAAQTVHVIRLEHDAAVHAYRFNPDRVVARAGDVLVFKVTGGGDHGLVFEGGMPAAARAALSAAMPRRVGDLSSPLLGPGSEYRIVLPSLPAGDYRFYCLPHRAYDEVGVLTIK